MPQIAHLENVYLSLNSSAGPVDILKGIDLKIEQCRSLAITGPSGSGKSTLLMAMTGLEKLTKGNIEIDNVQLNDLDEDELAKFRLGVMGIVFQNFHLINTMTALENVSLPLEIKNFSGVRQKAMDALEQVGLGDRAGHYPDQLSGGEQQRVALARALIAGTKILIADEPTGNLDQKTGAQIIDLMFELGRKHNMTLVLITHDKNLAKLCDRQIELVDGKIVRDTAQNKRHKK